MAIKTFNLPQDIIDKLQNSNLNQSALVAELLRNHFNMKSMPCIHDIEAQIEHRNHQHKTEIEMLVKQKEITLEQQQRQAEVDKLAELEQKHEVELAQRQQLEQKKHASLAIKSTLDPMFKQYIGRIMTEEEFFNFMSRHEKDKINFNEFIEETLINSKKF